MAVIRFTREEILGLRRASKALSTMAEFADILSAHALSPESLRPLDQDEVKSIIYSVLCDVFRELRSD